MNSYSPVINISCVPYSWLIPKCIRGICIWTTIKAIFKNFVQAFFIWSIQSIQEDIQQRILNVNENCGWQTAEIPNKKNCQRAWNYNIKWNLPRTETDQRGQSRKFLLIIIKVTVECHHFVNISFWAFPGRFSTHVSFIYFYYKHLIIQSIWEFGKPN